MPAYTPLAPSKPSSDPRLVGEVWGPERLFELSLLRRDHMPVNDQHREVKISFRQPNPGKFAIQNYRVYKYFHGAWVPRTEVDPDPNQKNVKGALRAQ